MTSPLSAARAARPEHVDVEASATGSRLASSPATLDGSPARRLYAGHDVSRAKTISDLRAMAHRRMPAFALEYLEGGAEEEATLSRNRAALAAYRFRPHALVDVSRRTLSKTLFDRPMALPFAIAPTGLNGLFWLDADLLLAEAAAEAGIPFIQSTMSNVAMERIARTPNLRHWWQLYVFGDPSVREALIGRAEQAGCEALVVTIDAQIYGDREWEQKRFTQPGHLTWASLFNAALHPRWLATTLSRGMPSFANVVDFVPEDQRSFFQSAFWIRGKMDLALDWDEMARIRAMWPRKLLIKGLLNISDIERAAEIGADGVVLSNHGGRQLDWTVSGLDVLPEARGRLGDRLTLIVDGGMRRGTDVLKALALGADAVLVGRATLYGVGAAGRDGVKRAIAILREEIERDIGLLGTPDVGTLGPDFLVH